VGRRIDRLRRAVARLGRGVGTRTRCAQCTPAAAPHRKRRRAAPRGQEIRKVGGFAIGDRVFHQKFGYGTVRAVEDNKLAIDFEHAGDKKVMDAFVERA